MKLGTPITETTLIALGFTFNNSWLITAGTLRIYKYPYKMVYVGIDSRNITNDDRMGLYNTNSTLEDVKEALTTK